MGDYLIKATAFEGKVRAYSLVATDMVNEAVRTSRYMADCFCCIRESNDGRNNDGDNAKRRFEAYC